MADPTSSSSAADVAFMASQTVAGKAAAGMLGAVVLYAVMPPINKDGTFNRREFVMRLAVAGVFSVFFGDWAVDVLNNTLPVLSADKHRAAVYLVTGAPGWWISRWVALYLQNRRDKDPVEIIKEAKDITKGN